MSPKEEVKFNALQINLQNSQIAQDLMYKVIAETKADIVFICEHNAYSAVKSWIEDLSHRAAIYVVNLFLKVTKYKTARIGSVRVEINVRC